MKRLALMIGMSVLAVGILGGCSNSGAPTGDAQLDKYEENRAKAEKLGGSEPAGETEAEGD